jgi:soluble lytic murein transglycosylase-like protein
MSGHVFVKGSPSGPICACLANRPVDAKRTTPVLLLQATFDLNDETPSPRQRRTSGSGALNPAQKVASTVRSRPRTQEGRRILLCAPATFRGQRTGAIPLPPGQKILFVDPQGWATRRRTPLSAIALSGNPYLARPLRMRQATCTTSLPRAATDMTTVLLAARRHVRAYRQPTANTLAMAAGTAVVAIVTHYWHSQALPPISASLAIEPPRLSVALPPPPMIDAPRLYTQLSRPTSTPQKGTPAFSASDLQRLVATLPVQAGHGDGFDLDIASPKSLWAEAGARFRIDPLLIYAVALVESKSAQADGSIAPSPWVVRVNGRMHKGSREDAVRAIQMAHRMALPVQDVGIMQVYYPVHRDIEPDPMALLNPVRNIEVGTGLLRKAMQETRDPVLRIGYYHSHDAQLARGYGRAVLSVYRELKMAMAKSPAASAVALARVEANAPALPAGG